MSSRFSIKTSRMIFQMNIYIQKSASPMYSREQASQDLEAIRLNISLHFLRRPSDELRPRLRLRSLPLSSRPLSSRRRSELGTALLTSAQEYIRTASGRACSRRSSSAAFCQKFGKSVLGFGCIGTDLCY